MLHKKGLNANTLKFIAIIAMTIDHLTWMVFPGYQTAWWVLGLHLIGRITAPMMWFFVAEGYHYTHDVKKYVLRMFLFALVSHFAYNFAFGIPFIPNGAFNQTSVMWALAWGLVGLVVLYTPRLRDWQKVLLIILFCALSFCADWSCIAVLAILGIGSHRGVFKRQMTEMVLYTAMYAAVYCIFIDWTYGILQLGVMLVIPFLRQYNGERGRWKGMKWFFYAYYPAHLVLCGILRILLHG